MQNSFMHLRDVALRARVVDGARQLLDKDLHQPVGGDAEPDHACQISEIGCRLAAAAAMFRASDTNDSSMK